MLLRGLSLVSPILSPASEPLLLVANHALPAAAASLNFVKFCAKIWRLSFKTSEGVVDVLRVYLYGYVGYIELGACEEHA